jgi:hypothetical protein
VIRIAREFDARSMCNFRQSFRVMRAHVRLNCRERNRAIHRARVNVEQTKSAREAASECGLARAGGAINGDDERSHGSNQQSAVSNQ